MDDLLDAAVRFAKEMLGKHGEFYPFGATVTGAGEVTMAAADPALGDHPDSLLVIEALTEAFRAAAARGEIRAAAICCDVRVDDGSEMTDAIRVTIEHRDDEPVHVLLPYRLDNGPSFGELRAARAPRAIFMV